MSKAIISKSQVKRLLAGGFVVDGHGRKYKADRDTMDLLQRFDENNLYDKLRIVFEDGCIRLEGRGGEE